MSTLLFRRICNQVSVILFYIYVFCLSSLPFRRPLPFLSALLSQRFSCFHYTQASNCGDGHIKNSIRLSISKLLISGLRSLICLCEVRCFVIHLTIFAMQMQLQMTLATSTPEKPHTKSKNKNVSDSHMNDDMYHLLSKIGFFITSAIIPYYRSV